MTIASSSTSARLNKGPSAQVAGCASCASAHRTHEAGMQYTLTLSQTLIRRSIRHPHLCLKAHLQHLSLTLKRHFIMSPSRETMLAVPLPATGMQDVPIMRPCRKFKGHRDSVRCILHLPGGQQIMTCSYDLSLRVWNLQTGRQISIWPTEEIRAWSIALSPNGEKVAIGGLDGLLRLYDVDTMEVIATGGQFRGISESVFWSGDGWRVMSVVYNRHEPSYISESAVKVWDLKSEKFVLEIETGIQHIGSAVYSPDHDTIMMADAAIAVRRTESWDANTSKLIASLKGHTGAVFCLAWTADGSTLISGSFDGSIRTWDTSTWQQVTLLTAHTGAVCGIAIHPTAYILASASWGNAARLWNLENGQQIGPPLQHAKAVVRVSFSTDGNSLATGCDNNAYIWDISSILRDPGLFSNPNGGHHQSSLDVDATQLGGQQHKNSTHRLHADFFQETPRHPDPLGSSRILL